jgi:hypothetical protein
MTRFDVSNSTLPLVLIATARPTVGHFHAVEVVDCHDGPREHVTHFNVIRSDSTIEVVDEYGKNADDVTPAGYARFVADEWHER